MARETSVYEVCGGCGKTVAFAPGASFDLSVACSCGRSVPHPNAPFPVSSGTALIMPVLKLDDGTVLMHAITEKISDDAVARIADEVVKRMQEGVCFTTSPRSPLTSQERDAVIERNMAAFARLDKMSVPDGVDPSGWSHVLMEMRERANVDGADMTAWADDGPEKWVITACLRAYEKGRLK